MSRWILAVTCLTILQICSVFGQNIMKSSLAFVLDSTRLLDTEISQFNDNVDRMFEYVTENSPIENFVLVTFNDPTAELLTITNDREVFKKYSTNIIAGGGGSDCPDYVMTGIKIALQNSLDFSTLYVITEASASDFNMYDEVRSMAIKKQIQINFITTGDCNDRNSNEFQVYYKLAKDTVGEVFPVSKSKVSDILEYVMESIKSRRYLMAYETLPSANNYKLNYTVDSQIDDVIVSITGSNLDTNAIRTIGPDGSDVITSSIFLNEEVMIIRVLEHQMGVFVTEINSDSEIYVKVTGKSNINFKCGFSSVPPTSLIETAARPAAVGNAYLSIQSYAEGINITTARVLDMSGNTLEELSLRTPSGDQNFFVSKAFDPPRTMFRIAVDGYDIKTKMPVSRKSAIPFERRNPMNEKREPMPPRITIEGWPKIITKYNVTYQLKCKAEGYPTPWISWHEKDSGKILPDKSLPIEEPFEFISILNIGEPIKNTSYECRASSSSVIAKKDIQIEVDTYFRVVQASEGCMTVEYEKEVSLLCKIDALPSATIIWYKDKSILTGDSNTVISNDNSSVTIKQMNFKTKGMYSCEAKHDLITQVFNSTLFLSGVEKPTIMNKNQTELRVFNGNDVELKCQINNEVSPKATIMWRYPQQSGDVYEEKNETSNTLYLRNVTGDQTGSYACFANNYLGTDFYYIDLTVEYPPMSNKDEKLIIVKVGTVVSIPCDVYGVPSPKINWYHNNSSIKTTNSITITSKNNLKFINIQHDDAGNYTCIAENEYGFLEKTFIVEVYTPVSIKIPDISAQSLEVNQTLILTCDAYGYPKPEIKWVYNDYHGKLRMQKLRFHQMSKSYFIQALQLKDEGYYTCIASNKYDSSRLTYQITVDAPPAIRSFYPDNNFNAVIGDMTLIIHCIATGAPYPEILWLRNNVSIALGNEEYDGKNGYLVIKNVSKTAQGDYSCLAQNEIGNSSLNFKVAVKDYPDPDVLNGTIISTSGKSLELSCKSDQDLKKTDRIRWYKDGQQLPNQKGIENNKLELENVSKSDSGIYSCRFNSMSTSYSLFFEVIIFQDNSKIIQNQTDFSNHR